MRTPRNDQLSQTDRAGKRGQHAPERCCVVTGDVAPAGRLVRLALGPDGSAPRAFLVDAPGYGYAATPHEVRAGWDRLAGRYLQAAPGRFGGTMFNLLTGSLRTAVTVSLRKSTQRAGVEDKATFAKADLFDSDLFENQ